MSRHVEGLQSFKQPQTHRYLEQVMCCDVYMSSTSVTATLGTRDRKVVDVVTGKQGSQAIIRDSDCTAETQVEIFDTRESADDCEDFGVECHGLSTRDTTECQGQRLQCLDCIEWDGGRETVARCKAYVQLSDGGKNAI